MAKKNNDFFKEKKAWSVVKDELLGCYLKPYSYVLNMPLRIKRGQVPKYRMIHATNHPAGALIMVDNIFGRWELMQDIQTDGQQSFWEENVDNELIDNEAIREKVISHLFLIGFDQGLYIHAGFAEHFKQNGFDFILINGEGRASVFAAVDLVGAYPFGINFTVFAFGLPPIVGGTAMGAIELTGEQVGVVTDTLAALYIFASAGQDLVGLIPQFFRNDGRNNLAGFILEHNPFLRREEFLLLGKHIHNAHFVAHIIAFVLGVV